MNPREYKPEDEPAIKSLRDHFHPDVLLPPRNGRIIEGVIEEEGKLIAYGVVATFAEAVLVMDLEQSLRKKYDIVRILMNGAIMAVRLKDIGELHVTATDPKWAGVLERLYGFKSKTGALVLEV